MDASPESSVISGFLGSGQSFLGVQVPLSCESLVVQIVAAKPNKEIVC